MPFSPTDIADCVLFTDSTLGRFDATSGGGSVTADNAAVKRWEDQSGAGNHLTQGTTGNALLYDAVKGVIQNTILTDQWFTGSIAMDNQSVSYFAIVNVNTLRKGVGASSNNSFFQLCYVPAAGYCTFGIAVDDSIGRGKLMMNVNGTNIVSSVLVPACQWALIGFTSSGSALTFWCNGVSDTKAAIEHHTDTTASYCGFTGFPMQGGYRAQVQYSRALNSTEAGQLLTWAQGLTVPASPTVNVHFQGDSITTQGRAILNRGYQKQMTTLTGRSAYCTSESQQRLYTAVADAANWVDQCKQTGMTNIAVLFEGTNDIASAERNASQTSNNSDTYVSDRRGAGWDHVIEIGMLPRNDVDVETTRQSLRTARLAVYTTSVATNIYSDGSGNYYVDLAADATIGQSSSPSDTTYFVDGVHPTAAGHAIIAGYLDTVMGLIVPGGEDGGDVPAAPTGVVVTPRNQGLGVSWTAVDGAQEYDILVNGVVNKTVSGTTFTRISGLTNGVSYAISIVAVNEAGESDPSDEVDGTPNAPAAAAARTEEDPGLGLGVID